MEYYQVQYQKIQGTWEPYGEAANSLPDARERFLDMLLKYKGYDQAKAFRICIIWLRWDKTWTVKEVIEYRDNKCAS